MSSAAAIANARDVSVGAGEIPAHVPRCPGRSQRPKSGLQAVLQQTPSTQKPVAHSAGVEHAPPCGMPVLVGVAVGVLVGVSVTVAVLVAVAVFVAVPVAVAVLVGVAVGVLLGVLVGVAVGVLEGHGQAGRLPHVPPPGAHAAVEHEPPSAKQTAHPLIFWLHRTLPPRKQWQQHAPSPPHAERRVMAWSASDALSAM